MAGSHDSVLDVLRELQADYDARVAPDEEEGPMSDVPLPPYEAIQNVLRRVDAGGASSAATTPAFVAGSREPREDQDDDLSIHSGKDRDTLLENGMSLGLPPEWIDVWIRLERAYAALNRHVDDFNHNEDGIRDVSWYAKLRPLIPVMKKTLARYTNLQAEMDSLPPLSGRAHRLIAENIRAMRAKVDMFKNSLESMVGVYEFGYSALGADHREKVEAHIANPFLEDMIPAGGGAPAPTTTTAKKKKKKKKGGRKSAFVHFIL